MVKKGFEAQSESLKKRWRDPGFRAMMSERIAESNRTRVRHPHSEETRMQISQSLIGHETSEETRDKIAQSLRERNVPEGTEVPEGMKFCPGCQRILPLDDFHKSSSVRNGRQSRCKECRAAYQRAKTNPPRTEGKKTCSQCGRTLSVSEFHRNKARGDGLCSWCKECNCAHSTAWNNEHVEYKREYMAQWQRDNPDKANARNHRRRARQQNAPGDGWTVEEWQALVEHYAPDGRCLRCGKKRKLTADHVVMLSDGGANDITNIQPLCRRCNSKKEGIDYRPDGGEWIRRKYAG